MSNIQKCCRFMPLWVHACSACWFLGVTLRGQVTLWDWLADVLRDISWYNCDRTFECSTDREPDWYSGLWQLIIPTWTQYWECVIMGKSRSRKINICCISSTAKMKSSFWVQFLFLFASFSPHLVRRMERVLYSLFMADNMANYRLVQMQKKLQ